MPINFHANTRKSLQSLYNTLFCNGNSVKIPSNKFNRCGQAKAELVGGNLSIIYSLLGSSSDIDTKNKILFGIKGCDLLVSKNNLWKLLENKYYVSLETSGLVDISSIPKNVEIVMDIKTPSSNDFLCNNDIST